METPPSSPTSLVVSSPRRTLSSLRERRATTASTSYPEEKATAVAPAAGFADEHGPKPSEVYGFIGYITTVIATVVYMVWAYTPEPWLHSLGITYYPSNKANRLYRTRLSSKGSVVPTNFTIIYCCCRHPQPPSSIIPIINILASSHIKCMLHQI